MIPPLRPYQQAEVHGFAHVPKRALFWQPRIGKTLASASSLQRGVPNLLRAVVIAPYNVCPMWARLLPNFGYSVVKLYEQPIAETIDLLRGARQPAVAVANYHRLGYPAAEQGSKRYTVGDLLALWKPDGLVIDESHEISSPSARWARQARALAWATPWVRCLSGTPVRNHYGSLWGQMAALDPAEWGYFYKDFKERYLVTDAVWPSMVLGYKNLDDLTERLRRTCSIKRREDVFGPDQWIIDVREVELPERAARLYERLAHEWLIDEAEPALRIDGRHILTRLVRLQQIASGYLVPDGGEPELIHRAKIDAVLGDLGELVASQEKAVVYHRFRWEGEQLAAGAATLGAPVLVINGDVPAREREEVERRIAADPGPLVALVQTQSGGVGISFAAATYALVVSQGFSFIAEEQARDRIFAPGVPRHVMYYRSLGTVDEYIAEVQDKKLSLHNDFVNIDRRDLCFGSRRKRTPLTPQGLIA